MNCQVFLETRATSLAGSKMISCTPPCFKGDVVVYSTVVHSAVLEWIWGLLNLNE